MLIIRRKRKGFTLVEAAITAALVGLLGSLVSVFFLQIYRSYSKTDAKLKVTQVAIGSLGSIQKQIREITQAPSCAPNTTLHPTSTTPITLFIPSLTDPTNRASDDRIDYYLGTYNGKDVMLQRLTRAGVTYTAIPVIFDFDVFRQAPGSVPQGGGVAAFLADPTLKFDDVAFFYDNTYYMVCVGITVSVADRGRGGFREKLSLTSAISIRNTF